MEQLQTGDVRTEFRSVHPSPNGPDFRTLLDVADPPVDSPKNELSEQGHVNLPEELRARVEQAVNDCEIAPTTEVQEALSGYYKDHYQLAALIEMALDGSLTDENIEEILNNPDRPVPDKALIEALEDMHEAGNLTQPPSVIIAEKLLAKAVKEARASTAEEKAESEQIVCQVAAELLQRVLFKEQSLGITTLGPNEMAVVRQIHGVVSRKSLENGAIQDETGAVSWETKYHRRLSLSPDSELISQIESLQESFWDDCRRAGQLEFHNTGKLDKIVTTASLMSRSEQLRRHGSFEWQTPRAKYHDEASGRRRMHSTVPHMSEMFDPTRLYTRGESSGTFAIPLAEVIKGAPYGRDAKYGLIRPKNSQTIEKVKVMTHVQPEKSGPNLYSDEHPSKYGNDRVFFKSPTEQGGEVPDAYEINIYSGKVSQIFIQGRDYKEGKEEVIGQDWYLLGEGSPTKIFIDKGENVEEIVQQLQDQALKTYGDQIVVPLRRGVFDFNAENIGQGTRYRQDAQYNLLPEEENEALRAA